MTAASWGSGYVTDVDYIPAFNVSQSQPLMAIAALLNNVHARPIGREEAFHYCDIGCGFGMTALAAAAANPGWHVTGLDFNPAHIAAARALARDAGIGNVQFLEVDLTDFAETTIARALPPFDVVTLHGVWSWVGQGVQDGILRLLNAKLLPGGMCHVSYNLLTGWQTVLGMQRLVREAGARLAGRSDRQASAGLDLAREIVKTGESVSFASPIATQVLEHFAGMNGAYLAHELMNENWRPLLHADVAARMAEAKLEYAGSTRLTDNVPQLALSDEQRALLDKFDDPAMLELFKDICQPQMMRNDIFVRGARRIGSKLRNAELGKICLGLVVAEADWKFEFDAAGGKAQMSEPYYRMIFKRLWDGPAPIAELLALPDLPGQRDNPAELIAVAISTGQVVAVPNPGAVLDERCRRLNAALLRRTFETAPGQPVHMAVPATGGGTTLPFAEAIMVNELAANPEIGPDSLADWLTKKRIGGSDRQKLDAHVENFYRNDAPLLRNFGMPV
jgi:SAM-dependent methyltransferase